MMIHLEKLHFKERYFKKDTSIPEVSICEKLKLMNDPWLLSILNWYLRIS